MSLGQTRLLSHNSHHNLLVLCDCYYSSWGFPHAAKDPWCLKGSQPP